MKKPNFVVEMNLDSARKYYQNNAPKDSEARQEYFNKVADNYQTTVTTLNPNLRERLQEEAQFYRSHKK